MPTYRNDGQGNVVIENLSGGPKTLKPGETGQSYKVYDLAGLTKTNDEPYYNPVVSTDNVTFTGAESKTVAINAAKTRKVLVFNFLGCKVTAYLESSANTPALHPPLEFNDVLEFDLDGNASKLVLVSDGAGSCVVKQLLD